MKGFIRISTKTFLLIITIAIIAAVLFASWNSITPAISKAISGIPSTLQDLG